MTIDDAPSVSVRDKDLAPGEPPWLDGPVPSGYWDSRENRLAYVLWLGRRLGFERPEDLYQLRAAEFPRHGGRTLMLRFRGTPFLLLSDVMPEIDWREWLFRSVPTRFFESEGNRRRFLAWFEETNGLRTCEDWYRVRAYQLEKFGGRSSLLRIIGSVAAVARYAHPDWKWNEWLFQRVPDGFWETRENRLRYVVWLEDRLGIGDPSGWLALTPADLRQHRGGELLARYRGSIEALVRDLVLRPDTPEWCYLRPKKQFWALRANRLRYLEWLAGKLGIDLRREARMITERDVVSNHGRDLVDRYGSIAALLDDTLEPSSRSSRTRVGLGAQPETQ